MDQLDLLKKDWKKQDATLPKFSQGELSKLIHKKSSSIVKWIFIISILELIIPYVIYLLMGYDSTAEVYEELNLKTFFKVFYTIAYIIVFYFIYRFYKNYKSISASSKPKELMESIIKTRKTVKHYIWFNLAMVPVVGSVVMHKTINSQEFIDKLPEDTNTFLFLIIAILIIGLATLIFWLFYQLLYGILLKRLKDNYKELVNTNGKEL